MFLIFIKYDKIQLVIDMEHYFTNNKNLKEDLQLNKVKVLDTEFSFYTDNGVFNKKGLDYGTRILLENLDFQNKKTFLDVGCGCGPIGIYISKQSDSYTVDMIDVNEKAVKLTNKSLKLNSISNANAFISFTYENITKKYDMILTNPPIHAGKKVVYDIIENAKEHLNENGELWVVIRKDQGAKSLIKDMDFIYKNEIVTKNNGFFIIKFSLK